MRWRNVHFKILDFSPRASRYMARRLEYYFEHDRWPDDQAQVDDELIRMALLGLPYVETLAWDEEG
jgi:hypothetical protein